MKQIGRGEPAEALRAYEKAGRLTVSPTRDDAERKLIERWREGGVTNPQDNLILASTNAEVSRLNRHAQELRREAGQLGLRSLRVGEEQIHEGDRVLFTETMKELGLVKADFATVTRLEQRTRKLTVQIDGQEKPVTFSLEKFDALRLGYAATTHRTGDDGRKYLCPFRRRHAEPRDELRADLQGTRRVPPLRRPAIGADFLGPGARGASLRREIRGSHD